MHDRAVSEVLLPVTTFRRVYDTMPVQEVLTLPELVAALRRFELKPEVLARTQREIARVRRATTRVKAGLHTTAAIEVRLQKAAEEARAARRDPTAAIEAAGLRLEEEARKKAKGELRVWSPTLYAPGAEKRGGEHVTHLSCLVLDHDDGTRIEDASARWSQYFHVVHSTWSHTEAHPRFRLVLPFAHLVAARDWLRVWQWAAARSGHAFDAALKNPSSHYALPAVPNPNWPRAAFSRPGALLSPVDEGLVDAVPQLPLVPQGPTDGQPSVMRGLDPTRQYLDHVDRDTVYLTDDPWEEEVGLEGASPAYELSSSLERPQVLDRRDGGSNEVASASSEDAPSEDAPSEDASSEDASSEALGSIEASSSEAPRGAVGHGLAGDRVLAALATIESRLSSLEARLAALEGRARRE